MTPRQTDLHMDDQQRPPAAPGMYMDRDGARESDACLGREGGVNPGDTAGRSLLSAADAPFGGSDAWVSEAFSLLSFCFINVAGTSTMSSYFFACFDCICPPMLRAAARKTKMSFYCCGLQ